MKNEIKIKGNKNQVTSYVFNVNFQGLTCKLDDNNWRVVFSLFLFTFSILTFWANNCQYLRLLMVGIALLLTFYSSFRMIKIKTLDQIILSLGNISIDLTTIMILEFRL